MPCFLAGNVALSFFTVPLYKTAAVQFHLLQDQGLSSDVELESVLPASDPPGDCNSYHGYGAIIRAGGVAGPSGG